MGRMRISWRRRVAAALAVAGAAVTVVASGAEPAAAAFDCTASAGACVIGLVRWEQDATITARLRPLTFATG